MTWIKAILNISVDSISDLVFPIFIFFSFQLKQMLGVRRYIRLLAGEGEIVVVKKGVCNEIRVGSKIWLKDW